MIASENILSPLVRKACNSDLHGRYAEGLPGKRYYQGCDGFDTIEEIGISSAKRVFDCNFANIQSTSGTVSNMAGLKALANPGDTITAVSTADGGHISHARMGAVGLRGLNLVTYPWVESRMEPDIDAAAQLIRETEPNIALFGQSVFLFPTPLEELAAAGAELLLNLSASPWSLGKEHSRHVLLSQLSAKAGCPVVYCNLVGGNDELVFDGGSQYYNGHGVLGASGAMFAEDLLLVDTETIEPKLSDTSDDDEKLHKALSLGVHDYLHKCGFASAVIGLSGGIDSAVTAVIAVDALSAENVRGVAMPSQYSSQGSLDDAERLANALGIRYDIVPIEPVFEQLKSQLGDIFDGLDEDTAEENMQARIRGNILMSMSNKFGSLLLTTGNKSELAVGYCTLYGDMCGGLAVISDLPKTRVYSLAKWINREREIIPESTLTKPPSAELRPDQVDQDSLPPYDVLDSILEAYVVDGQDAESIIASGHDKATVQRIIRLINLNEYKRRQAAPGIKVTSKAFGVGRRIPVAKRFS